MSLLRPVEGPTASLVQRLTTTRPEGVPGPREVVIDVLLELRPEATEMVLLMGGVRVLLVRWDGETLHQERSPQLPKEISSRRLLLGMQLTYWPEAAVRKALHTGVRLDESEIDRVLLVEGRPMVEIHYPPGGSRIHGTTSFLNHRSGNRLVIESAAAERREGAPP